MTTTINSATPNYDSGSPGFLIGIVAIIGFAILFIFFGIPAMQNMEPIQLNIPAPQVVIPNKIDVNVQQSK